MATDKEETMMRHKIPCGCECYWEKTSKGYNVGFVRCALHKEKLRSASRPTAHILIEEIDRLHTLLNEIVG